MTGIDWVRACPLADLAPDRSRRVASRGTAALLTVVDGHPYAVADHCLHRAGRLSGGILRDGLVTCPEHWWRYDVRTGARTDHPDKALECFAVRVVEDWVEVGLPPAPGPAPTLRELLLAHARGEDR